MPKTHDTAPLESGKRKQTRKFEFLPSPEGSLMGLWHDEVAVGNQNGHTKPKSRVLFQ